MPDRMYRMSSLYRAANRSSLIHVTGSWTVFSLPSSARLLRHTKTIPTARDDKHRPAGAVCLPRLRKNMPQKDIQTSELQLLSQETEVVMRSAREQVSRIMEENARLIELSRRTIDGSRELIKQAAELLRSPYG